MIPAKALYSFADSFLPARATRSAGKIKTDSARLPSQADALAEAQSGVIGRIFEFQVRSSSRPGCAESVFRACHDAHPESWPKHDSRLAGPTKVRGSSWTGRAMRLYASGRICEKRGRKLPGRPGIQIFFRGVP
ncbi:MAG: hypothetical protein INF18_08965 [Methylobacterium sp.]|jgi:hypothetical protein|nr:hypothetical protein [Methylobacterium sp.]MCA3637305.1 hypothetical protein [Methylobacterium sp.]